MPALSQLSRCLAPYSSRQVEIVERKGIGHPDTICDALAEELSRHLCQFYLDNFGLILHHNVDKALLRGGTSKTKFGGGRIESPIEIFLAGRATSELEGIKVPVDELVWQSCNDWLQSNFHALDTERAIKLHSLIRPGSLDLVELYRRQQRTGVALANDTSCGVGYAPLSELERIVLRVERTLNSAEVKSAHPEIGEDVKVMAIRHSEVIELTVACAFIDRYLTDIDDYRQKKSHLAGLILQTAGSITDKAIDVYVNTADDVDAGSVYMTVTGTSAESGDDGEVGRGNRVNGLITPYRPMNMEAAAGKNPVTHVGKLYNIAAQQIAAVLVQELDEVDEAYCHLVSRIGAPIDQPRIIDIHLGFTEGDLESMQATVDDIVYDKLARMDTIRQDLISGTISVY